MRLTPVFDDRDADGLARHFERTAERWGEMDDVKKWELMLLAREACQWFTANPPNYRTTAQVAAEANVR